MKEFIDKLSSLSDLSAITFKINEFIQKAEAGAFVEFILDLIEDVIKGSVKSRRILIAFVMSDIKSQLSISKAKEIVKKAQELGFADIINAIIDPQMKLKKKTVLEKEIELYSETQGNEEKTLGYKKNIARKADRLTIEKLCFDKNPDVIKNLLLNPKLILADVIKIAALRPNNPKVLSVLKKNPKWISQGPIRNALVQNPYTPLDISLLLLTSLSKNQLKDVSCNTLIHPILRELAGRIVVSGKW
ncbi:MAG: hypothetical protein ABIA04_03570 [Pseudomonadota bacterium]